MKTSTNPVLCMGKIDTRVHALLKFALLML